VRQSAANIGAQLPGPYATMSSIQMWSLSYVGLLLCVVVVSSLVA